jgi:nicotinamidase-related amidase
MTHPNVLDAGNTALIVVDVQERFRTAMGGFDAMAAACARLVRAARILGLPVFVTEQYPKGLGRTVPEIIEALGGHVSHGEAGIPEKTLFSSLGCAGLEGRIRGAGVRAALVCGIETHVCVSQTVHDLLALGYAVHVAADAVESRHPANREAGLRKMERSGAVLTSSEMAVFELLRDARHPRFKEVQALFK